MSLVGLYLLSGPGGDFTCAATASSWWPPSRFGTHPRHGAGGPRHDVGALLAIQLGVGGVVPLAIAAAGGHLEAPEGGTVWSALIVTPLFASALGFFVQTFAQQHAPPARTALILASEPAFAGLFGWLLADDRLSPTEWLGAGLIMAAIVAVEVTPRFRPPRRSRRADAGACAAARRPLPGRHRRAPGADGGDRHLPRQ